MSPFDEFALEAALRTRDEVSGEVVVVTLGDESSKETLRSALAMGADRAVLLHGEISHDGLATAKALAAEVMGASPELVLLGVKAADDDQEQVGPMLATILGCACATAVSSFTVEGGGVTCEREVDGGVQTVALPVGSVLTITKGEFEPRQLSLRGIMAAKERPMEVKDAAVVPARVRVGRVDLPPAREAGRIVGDGVEAVSELVRLLREEARLI